MDHTNRGGPGGAAGGNHGGAHAPLETPKSMQDESDSPRGVRGVKFTFDDAETKAATGGGAGAAGAGAEDEHFGEVDDDDDRSDDVWEEHWDDRMGIPYYYNPRTDTNRWEKPTAASRNMRRRATFSPADSLQRQAMAGIMNEAVAVVRGGQGQSEASFDNDDDDEGGGFGGRGRSETDMTDASDYDRSFRDSVEMEQVDPDEVMRRSLITWFIRALKRVLGGVLICGVPGNNGTHVYHGRISATDTLTHTHIPSICSLCMVNFCFVCR